MQYGAGAASLARMSLRGFYKANLPPLATAMTLNYMSSV
jgi:hypothetical protein